jgi:DNA-binding HxlR family transcriptional regulator
MDASCVVYATMDLIAKKWSLLIILSLHKTPNKRKQYSALKKDLSLITPKILAQRLKELEHEGILFKETDTSTIPVRTFYSLTPSGQELITIIEEIKKWGLKHAFKTTSSPCKTRVCKDCHF